MDLKLKNKIALVTGSTGGIGFSIALGLLKEGATVIINGRKKAKIEEAIISLKKAVPKGDISGIKADFAKSADIEKLIKKTPEVDILINNVGVFGDQPFETTSDTEWMRDFEINVMSGVRLSRHYLPKMMRKNWGRVIFLSSESAVNIPEDMILYGVTKTAYLALSRGLAKYAKGTNVTVNAVLPGPTWSDANTVSMAAKAKQENISIEEASLEFIQEKRPSSIIQRFATGEEVANMIVYLSSELSSATTGAAIRVDGGVVNSAF